MTTLPTLQRGLRRLRHAGLLLGLLAGLGLAAPTAAVAGTTTVPSFACGGFGPMMIKLQPTPMLSNAEFTNPGADCAMWQTFFYLNWPAKKGVRGVPDLKATFGAPGPTVWETFKTEEQVFLPQGATPSPWNQGVMNASVPKALAGQAAAGRLRVLTRTSKVSRQVASLLQAGHGLRSAPVPLDQVEQADGYVLYDQQNQPVYYDVAMNKAQFDYIVSHKLYNADSQAAYAARTNIVLPMGAIEVKAAWKVLTATEAASGRFHTAPGFVPSTPGAGSTVTVGLVGLHVFAAGGPHSAGMWATFYQIDNAPLAGTTATGTYTFYNPASSTPVNTTGTSPTQVKQVFPDDPQAASINAKAQGIIVQGNASAPWQYYAMVDTQWSPTALTLSSPVPATTPLSAGTVSTATLTNAVLETFMQTQGNSCLGCHSFAATARPQSTTASGFSFMFGNAQARKKK
ncbi:MAG: hypothetical protein KF686_05775 [Ramlibacter sp.]|nr:hypothetical protein [Ramlibacter sp.]